MNLVKKSQTNKFAACQSTTIFEYLMKDPEISGAVAKINGRYPETGFSLNEKSKELVYVIEGNGRIIQTNKEITIQIGDVILLNHNAPSHVRL